MTEEKEYEYLGKPLSSYSLWDLGIIETGLKAAKARREEASKHPKFNIDRQIGDKLVKKINLPPPNPEFLKLKNAIEAEIRKRQTNV